MSKTDEFVDIFLLLCDGHIHHTWIHIYIECCNSEKAGSRGASTDMSVAQLPSSGLALVRGGQPPAAER